MDTTIENFSEQRHRIPIRDFDTILSATGKGKAPFISVHDIAAVAFRALTDEVPHNMDHVILGPELLSYDDVRHYTLLSASPMHVS
jgi:festuclavine dehydrogenase